MVRRCGEMAMDNKFTLILAEKPDAAKRIATALAQKIISSPGRGELPFYEILRNGERIRVMAAVGHLYTLKQSGKGWDYPVLSMEWVPRYEVDKTASNTRRFVQKFRELSVDTGSFMVATDYDIEGETIAYCILKYACGENAFRQAKRLRFSSLTDRELVEAYEHPLAHIDLRMAEAGETRHKVDWLFGINISRALILAVKHATGRYWTLSTGRVQGPTLTFVANRESAIRSFVPTPYWIINASAEMEGQFYHLGTPKIRSKRWMRPSESSTHVSGRKALLKKSKRSKTRRRLRIHLTWVRFNQRHTSCLAIPQAELRRLQKDFIWQH